MLEPPSQVRESHNCRRLCHSAGWLVALLFRIKPGDFDWERASLSWPRLHSLELDEIDSSHERLAGLLFRHKMTLKSIQFFDVGIYSRQSLKYLDLCLLHTTLPLHKLK